MNWFTSLLKVAIKRLLIQNHRFLNKIFFAELIAPVIAGAFLFLSAAVLDRCNTLRLTYTA
jgi:hypothetical protein